MTETQQIAAWDGLMEATKFTRQKLIVAGTPTLRSNVLLGTEATIKTMLEGLDAFECEQCGHWFPDDKLVRVEECNPPPGATEPADDHYTTVDLCQACHLDGPPERDR